MIINNKKILFIHVPKTGGSTIRSILKKKYPSAKIISNPWEHSSINDYIKEGYNIDDYFKFAFVRNPWDRLLSNYFFRIQRLQSEETASVRFRDWVLNSKTKEGHSFLDTGEMYKTQLSYITLNKTQKLDFIGRYENLQQDWNFICDQLQIEKQKLPHKNKSSHSSYINYYNEDTVNIVGEYFKEDVENFGYKFGE
jgi:hypothetical protein